MEKLKPVETLASILSIGTLALLANLAFTKKQRDAIVERDDAECQMPKKHTHKGGLQVHHILNQRYAQEIGFDPDYPENAITICEEAHTGEDGIHTDIFRAKKAYAKNKNSFAEVFAERDEKIKNREITWNPEWDRQMSAVAVKRTQEAKKRGWIFPPKKNE